MIYITDVYTYGWNAAFRGMRNPKDSWVLSDSIIDERGFSLEENPDFLGKKDLELAEKLHKAGPVHSKYKRFIMVTMDVTAPLYWWKEYDTYKVGTATNSCSTMHRITKYPFSINMFSHEHLNEANLKILNEIISALNDSRDQYLILNDKFKKTGSQEDAKKLKEQWWQIIQLLPSSFNQKRTLLLNYEVLSNIYLWRHNHKQDEWVKFCDVIMELPYAKNIICPSFIDK